MARALKPPVAAPVEVDEVLVRKDRADADVIRAAENMVMDFEEPLRQLGQIEAFDFLKRVSDVATAQVFANLRNTGKYKGLPYRDQEGNLKYVSDLEEFCQVKLGKTYRRCFDLANNLSTLGPDLYEQSERLGLRNLDYKALRALPSDDQVLIKKAIEEAQSRDEVIDLLQEMAVKHAKEKEALQQQLAEQSEDIEAKESVIAQKNGKIAELVGDKNRREGMTEAEQHEELEERLNKETLLAAGGLLPLRQVVHEMRSLERCPQGMYVAMQGALDRVIAEAMSIATDYGIQLNLTTWPEDDDLADPNAGEVFEGLPAVGEPVDGE